MDVAKAMLHLHSTNVVRGGGKGCSPPGITVFQWVVKCGSTGSRLMPSEAERTCTHITHHMTAQIHSDLKARNVLLKTASTDDARGFVAKGENRTLNPTALLYTTLLYYAIALFAHIALQPLAAGHSAS